MLLSPQLACLSENQDVGVVLTKCNTAVTDFIVTMLWSRLESRNHFPNNGLGIYLYWDFFFDISMNSPGPFIFLLLTHLTISIYFDII